MDELEGRDTERKEKKKKSGAGPRGFKGKSGKSKGASPKRKTKGPEGVLDGVFQRCAPYMMLWKHEEEGTQHKYVLDLICLLCIDMPAIDRSLCDCRYDLRVYVAVSREGK